jgi:hypothetical protein
VSAVDRALNAVFLVGVLVMFAGACLIARHNLRVNRADRRGAIRVAAVIVCAFTLSWLVGAHHVTTISLEFANLLRSADVIVANGVIVWVVYIALEPYVRRFWPDSLLGWTRLLSGRVRDPRVGRDALAGVAFGVALSLTQLGQALLPPLVGFPAPPPSYGYEGRALLGLGWMLAEWFSWIGEAEVSAMMIVLLFVVLRLTLKRPWLTVGAGVVVIALAQSQNIDNIAMARLFPLAAGALVTLVALRFGLLPLAVMFLVANVVTGIPLTLDLGHWSAVASTWSLAAVTALALFSFYSARGGQPLFGDVMLIADGR